MPIGEEIFDQLPIGTGKPSMVDGKSVWQQVLQLLRLDTVDLGLQNLARGRVGVQKLCQGVILHRQVAQCDRGLHGLLPRVDEDEDLALAGVVHELLVADLVHGVEALDGLLVRDADVGLLQRAGPVLVAKIEEPPLGVDAQEDGHVLVVRQRGREAHEADVLLRGLDLPDRPRDDGLQNGPAGVVQEVDLVDDDEPHELRVGALIAGLAGDDVPLLRRRHDDLRLIDLRLGEVDVAAQLPDDNPVALQPLLKALNDLLHEGLHGRHVDDLEAGEIEGAVLEPELRHDVQDREHRAVGLARAGRSADEHVLAVLAEGDGVDLALHVVELRGAGKRLVAPRGQL
mmetsp:Transcript_97903/g.274102  ORF Transcript_97903/g.274102 Transcript_97903/m.274102 type:complete len:343 (+) Transcript_97903:4089-5117(+)